MVQSLKERKIFSTRKGKSSFAQTTARTKHFTTYTHTGEKIGCDGVGTSPLTAPNGTGEASTTWKLDCEEGRARREKLGVHVLRPLCS